MCCSNWNGWNSAGGWNGRCCACRCVCWSPFGTQALSGSGSAAADTAVDWPVCAGANWSAATAGTTGCGCNG